MLGAKDPSHYLFSLLPIPPDETMRILFRTLVTMSAGPPRAGDRHGSHSGKQQGCQGFDSMTFATAASPGWLNQEFRITSSC